MSENPSTQQPGPRRNSLFMTLLPLAPILVAIGIALAVKQQTAGPATSTGTATGTQPGLAVGALAPDFSLPDVHKEDGDEPATLSLMVRKSPVLIVFILGYNCPHCIAHLQEIEARRDGFDKAGVQIIAITPDSPTNLRDSIKTFGDLNFPFLSDLDSKVARAYGLREEDMRLHGMFLVDKERRISFAAATEEPFSDLEKVLQAAKKLQTVK